MFSVKDLVVGMPNNGFGVTSNDCLLEVTEVFNCDGEYYFTGTVVAHREKKYKAQTGSEYSNLPVGEFKLATSEEIESIKNAAVKPKKEKAAEEFKLNAGLTIRTFEDGSIESTFNKLRELRVETDSERLKALTNLMDKIRGQKPQEMMALSMLDMCKDYNCFSDIFSKKEHEKALDKFIDFFKEFQFEPNFRFINTLCLKSSQTVEDAIEYVKNYFKLLSSPYVTSIVDKMKSPEFKELLYFIALGDPSEIINKRFKIYYGSAGTGKTTEAMKETNNRVIVCNNSMLPQDLIEDFGFEDGKAGFHKSILRECMEQGKKITLDEINLLPFETIRFLQGILDDKKQINWKGEVIKIEDGFEIIGTMNLMVNGMAYGLPEPLVDRCLDIKEFQLTGKQLLAALR